MEAKKLLIQKTNEFELNKRQDYVNIEARKSWR